MPLELTPAERTEAIQSLRKFFAEERDEELSDLQGRLLLDFVLKEIAPLAYNRGVHDAENFFRKHVEDLPATCYEPPFTHWTSPRRR